MYSVETVHALQHRWTELDQRRGSLLSNCEEYASWTLPYIFPATNSDNVELQNSKDSIGAQAVNHLSNKVVSTLFPGQRLFFRLAVDAETRELLMASTALTQNSDETRAELERQIAKLDEQLLGTEKRAIEYLDMVAYRPVAVHAAKLLIITGNALMYHPKGKPTQAFSLRQYCVQRDLSGEVVEIMTKEEKSFETFSKAVQDLLRVREQSKGKQYVDSTNVTIYTRIRLEDDGRYHAKQCADHVTLNTEGAIWTKKTLPYIALTWNLIQGEDYGRGLVSEYAGAFHGVNTLSNSLLNIAAIMGDIKFLVNPTSLLNVAEMNKSAPGSYHSGKENDITTPKVDKVTDAQFIQALIERYERQIAQAFLLNSQLTRNAERVTAEEIRRDANELEVSQGGVYSRMAAQWQLQTAYIVLDAINFVEVGNGIIPQVITGMDSLSRTSEMDNMHMYLIDLAALNNVPEDVRAYVRVPDYMALCGRNRQVDYKVITKTQEERNAELQQEYQMAASLEAQRQQGVVAAEAGKTAIKEG